MAEACVRLLAQYPEEHSHEYADDEASGQWEIKPEMFALNDDITGKSAKTYLAEPGPQDADEHE